HTRPGPMPATASAGGRRAASRRVRPGGCRPRAAAGLRAAAAAGLGINAGHDLSQSNLAAFLDAVPNVLEVSIGHALIGEALYDGLAATVRRYLSLLGAVSGKASR
ncbi:MAG: pyridoxine 5'-phosphate synthase, partial [Luteimonas sp.]|nr:pyridoxine 5'-phosphate synthase [Luteimonas sp.]